MQYTDLINQLRNLPPTYLALAGFAIFILLLSALVRGIQYISQKNQAEFAQEKEKESKVIRDREDAERKARTSGQLETQLAERIEDVRKLNKDVDDLKTERTALSKELKEEKDKVAKWKFYTSAVGAFVAIVGTLGTFLATTNGSKFLDYVFAGKQHEEDVKQIKVYKDEIAEKIKGNDRLDNEKKIAWHKNYRIRMSLRNVATHPKNPKRNSLRLDYFRVKPSWISLTPT